MSVKIPELSFSSTFKNYASYVISCDGYSAISYYIVTSITGELIIQTSVDGINFYQNTLINMLSTGTVYTDRLNVNYKYCKFLINLATDGDVQLQSFFFSN